MTQNGDKPNSPRRTCGNHKGDDQNEENVKENEKENDNDNDNKEETGSRRNGNRNGDNRSGSSNGDRHNGDGNNNNDSDDDGDEDGDKDGDENGEDENDEENDEDDKKKDEDGKRNGQGGKQKADPPDVIAEESDEQKGEPNDADDACEEAKGKEIKSEADGVKNGATDMQNDSNQGDGNGNKGEGEGVKVDSVDEGKNKSCEEDRVNNEDNQNNIKKNIKEEASKSEVDCSGGMETHISRNCRGSGGGSGQRNDQTGKDEKDEKNLRIMNKLLKNLSFMSFNTGLLEYKICGVCIYQNPPFISNRLLHIPFALKKTNADIIALQEVYDEKHVEYLKNHLTANYPFCARDNYCSDVFKEKFSDVNVAREDEFDEDSPQDGNDSPSGRNGASGRDGPSDRTANSYENGKRTGTSTNTPNVGNKKEPRCRKKKYFALHHGLLVFSKYPIIYSFFHGFKHVTYLEHLFGTKGFLEVVIDVPFFSYITLVNMHLASGAADTESKYIERVRDFEIKQIMEIARNAEKRNTIPIIIGDLNAAPNLCPNNYSSFIKRGWKDAWLYARNVKKKKTKQLIGKALPRLQKKKPRTISPNSCHSLSHLFPRVGSTPEDLVKKEAKKAEREEMEEMEERREREETEERRERAETEENHPRRNGQKGVKNKRKENPISGITNKDNAYSNHSVNTQKSIYHERPPLDNKVDTKNDELGSRSSLRVFPSFNCSENNDSIVYSNSGKTLCSFCTNIEHYDCMYHNEGYTKEREKWNVGDNSVECYPSVCIKSASLKNHASEMDKMNCALNNGALNKNMQFRNGLQSRYSGCVSHTMTARSRRRAVTDVPSKRLLIPSKQVARTVSKMICRRKFPFLTPSYKRVKRHHRKGRTRGCHQKEHLPHVKQIPPSCKNHTHKRVNSMGPSQRGDILHCDIIPNSSTASGKDNPSDVIPELKGEAHMLIDERHYRQMSLLSSRGGDVVNHQEGDHDLFESILHVDKTQDDLFNPPMWHKHGPNCCTDKGDKGEKKERQGGEKEIQRGEKERQRGQKERQRNMESCSTCDVFKKEDKIGNTTVTPKCTLRSKNDGEKLEIHREEDEGEYHAVTNVQHHYNSDQNLFSSDISSESNHSYTDLYDDEEEANWFSDRSSNASRNDLQERVEVGVPIEEEPIEVINCMTEEGFTNGGTTEKAPETIKELHISGSNQLTDKNCTKGEDRIMTHFVPPPEMGVKRRGDERTPLFHPKETAQVYMSNGKDDDTSTHAQMHREKDSKLSGITTLYKNQLNGHKGKVHNVDENCEDKLKIQNLCSTFLKEELSGRGDTHEEDSLLSEVGTRRDGNDWYVTDASGKNGTNRNSCNDKMESLPYTGTYPTEETANINMNEKKKKISKPAKKIKQMKKKLFYNILRNYERHHDGGVERKTSLKGEQGDSPNAKQEREEGNSRTLEDVKRKTEKNHHVITSLNEREHTEKENNCKGEAAPVEDHSPRSDVTESLKNEVINEKGKNKSGKFLHFTKKWYSSRTQEALKKDIFYFIKKLKFKTTNKLKQKFRICAKNVKGSLSEEKKLVLMEEEQKSDPQQVHNKCSFVQDNSDPTKSFSSIKLTEDFIKMCECAPLLKKERNQRSKNYNREKAPTWEEDPENYPKSKKDFIFKRRQKEEKDRHHLVENSNEGRIHFDDHNCVSPNRNSSKNKKCTYEYSRVDEGESNQGQFHNKMNPNTKNKNFFKLKSEENISSDEFTWDPLNPLNVIGPHSRCNGLRCDYIFFPPISYNKGKGARKGKNGTAEKGKAGQNGKPIAAEKADETYKTGAVKSQPSVHITKMRDDEQLLMGGGKAPNRSNVSFDPVGANRESQKCSNSVWNTQNDAFNVTRNGRDRKDDHQAKGKRYEEALNQKKYNDLKILKHYYIKSAKILFNEPSVMVHTHRNYKNFNCCYSFCMKIKNVHFVTMSDHYAIKIDLRLKKNHKFVRNS
ncbi:endonuclease/exonuclease/phosphatase domain containing protein [Plasmodium cynomolgi strain B]|uniref:Endonuclease/exonuclease/phosphatase domain containing protein n=1 Tax=Plasmodium cynomolgi (strain B) TaxID=1120755 RepID=K6UCY0_PLACD|nr:endonuclease/exonuclease/phosphatase domain containing protein [Plasmodium cynomolgi strain B]GAB65636.1 endonuclease/exonuclease/phosphatase domain containing protein [Plasmodium cynomolgi strain B]